MDAQATGSMPGGGEVTLGISWVRRCSCSWMAIAPCGAVAAAARSAQLAATAPPNSTILKDDLTQSDLPILPSVIRRANPKTTRRMKLFPIECLNDGDRAWLLRSAQTAQ